MLLRGLFITMLLAGCASRQDAPLPVPQNPSPMVDYTRAHERIEERAYPGLRFTIEDLLDKPAEVFVPQAHQAADSLKLLIHFHGAGFIGMEAVQAPAEPYALAAVNLGSGSSVYERAFTDPATLPRLIDTVTKELGQRRPEAPVFSSVVLSAFSAGYGAARAILRSEQASARVEGVILLDGLHTGYVPERAVLAEGGRLDTTNMEPFLRLAQAAARGEKWFLITHSEIFPGTYASTTETADYLIQRLGLKRTPVLKWGPGGMQQLSEVRAGRFIVLGFAGNTAPDHVDHLHALPRFLAMLSL